MQKMTLLEMVQNIASALDTDEVNSITDTVESLQIAEVIKETFFEQFNNIYIPEHQTLFRMSNVADLDRPNYLEIPTDISKVLWIKYYDYGTMSYGRELDYMNPEEFFDRLLTYYTYPDTWLTEVTDASGITYFVPNNTRPMNYTILDDRYMVFDGYDSANEATLQGSKTVAYGTKAFAFQMEDDFVPPLDANLFPLLLAEAKSVCFINLKQISSSKEEQRARRQRIRMQNDQFRSSKAQYEYWHRGPNFARRR
jgi:hypothetical protein